jgi:hypothetical protein
MTRQRFPKGLYDEVMARDNWMCLAPSLDPSASGTCSGPLTLDHVKDFAMMGDRAPHDALHLLVLCMFHNNDGWASSHRDIERRYLMRVNKVNCQAPDCDRIAEIVRSVNVALPIAGHLFFGFPDGDRHGISTRIRLCQQHDRVYDIDTLFTDNPEILSQMEVH